MIEAIRLTLRAILTGDGQRGRMARTAVGTMAVSAVGTLVSFGVSVLLARVLGKGGFGTYSLAMSAALLVAVGVRLGFPELLIREVARSTSRGDGTGIPAAVAAADRVSGTIGVAVIATAWIFIKMLDLLGPEPVLQNTAIAAVVLVAIIALTENHQGALRGLSRVIRGQLPSSVIRPAVLGVIVLISVSSGAILDAASVMWLHVGAGGVALAVVTFWLADFNPVGDLSGRPQPTGQMLRASLPFAGLSLIWVTNGQVDLLMLGGFSTASEVGIYRVALATSAFASFFLSAGTMVTQPEVARLHLEAKRDELQRLIRSLTRITSIATLPLLAIFVVAGLPFIRLAYGGEYVDAYVPVLILLVGHALNVAIGPVEMVLNMTGHEKESIRGRFAALVTAVVAGLLLVPAFEAVGAAVTAALSMVTWNVYMLLAVRHHLGISTAAWHRD